MAGIGNVFLGDDGFGPEVLKHVLAQPRAGDVYAVDYGIRGMHLAYDLLDGWRALVLVDALPDRGAPGRLHVFETDHESLPIAAGFESHSVDPGAVFATLAALGGSAPPTFVVGCEVQNVDDGMELSGPVAAAVPAALLAVEDLLTRLGAHDTTRAEV